MMIGPEPMIRIFLRSVRFGMGERSCVSAPSEQGRGPPDFVPLLHPIGLQSVSKGEPRRKHGLPPSLFDGGTPMLRCTTLALLLSGVALSAADDKAYSIKLKKLEKGDVAVILLKHDHMSRPVKAAPSPDKGAIDKEAPAP